MGGLRTSYRLFFFILYNVTMMSNLANLGVSLAPSMKILAYVGTFNESVDQALAALARQTVAIDETVVVDNASQNSIGGPFPRSVTVLRNSENLGPSGAITAGLRYGLAHGYEWMWIFDSDSYPHPEALEWLCSLYRGLPEEKKREVGILSCSHVLLPTQRILRGRRFTSGGPRPIRPARDSEFYECDAVIWSGSLYRLEAVRAVGWPRCGRAGFWEDLSHDYGDLEFSNRMRRAGYQILVHTRSLVYQSIGETKEVSWLGYSLLSTNHPASRRYLYFRYLTFFWAHLFPRKNWAMLSLWFGFRLSANVTKILIMERDRATKIRACLRGCRDGLRRRMAYPFDPRNT
jgi:GT2 family glycosyltransferase